MISSQARVLAQNWKETTASFSFFEEGKIELQSKLEDSMKKVLQIFFTTPKLLKLDIHPGWNCLNFLHVFVGYQANFP